MSYVFCDEVLLMMDTLQLTLLMEKPFPSVLKSCKGCFLTSQLYWEGCLKPASMKTTFRRL